VSRRALYSASGGAIYRHRYIAPPEALYSAPTDMYRPGPIHNTGRYLAGFALHTGTATYRAQTRYIGGATFLTVWTIFFTVSAARYGGIPRDTAGCCEIPGDGAKKSSRPGLYLCDLCVISDWRLRLELCVSHIALFPLQLPWACGHVVIKPQQHLNTLRNTK